MKLNRLETTTICYPFEYNLVEEINNLIVISNDNNKHLVPCDVGKVVGLYKSASELYSILLDIIVTNEHLTESQLEESKIALDNFFRNSSTPRSE